MASEEQLRQKLRKIEALFAGATTAGERAAAGAAADRIRSQFEAAGRTERLEEFKFSVPDPWARQLFVALCRRYGLKPFRYRRMRSQTIMVKGPASVINQVLWPEFEQLSAALSSHLFAITSRIIREEVHQADHDVDEVEDTPQLL